MRTVLKLLVLIICLLFGNIVYAQEEEPKGPIYIVEAGDTLYSIALQFGITVDDLISANELEDANQIFVGDRLVIPGLEGVKGVLETRPVPFGENFRSLSRQHQIPVDKLIKLNRLVSPGELFVGTSLILPVLEGNSLSDHRRVVLPEGQSVLELAVLENMNPWRLSFTNVFSVPTNILPGDVIFAPPTASADDLEDIPGALPSPIDSVEISDLYQGETGVIKISFGDSWTLRGKLGPHQLNFVTEEQRMLVALQGIHALGETGLYPLILEGKVSEGKKFGFSQNVVIRPRQYLYERINVPPELIDPEVTENEGQMVASMVEPVTNERLWKGVFQAPSPFADCINSSFGNRRSYNGSPFVYYHGGVDFCGGEGVEIKAPANGVVVFADQLEVRGNFTLIDHGWGVYSSYLHQSEIFVEVGDHVDRGMVIGLIGNTGRSTGAHLHWEVWVGGVLVNPLDWLERTFP